MQGGLNNSAGVTNSAAWAAEDDFRGGNLAECESFVHPHVQRVKEAVQVDTETNNMVHLIM